MDDAQPALDTVFRRTLALAAIVVIVAGLKLAQAILVPLIIALFIAILCAPAFTWLTRHRIPRVLAVLIIMLLVFLLLSGFGAVVGKSVNEFTDELPSYQARWNAIANSMDGWLEGHKIDVAGIEPFKMVNAGSALSMLGGTLKGTLSVLSNGLMVLLIVIFMLLEWSEFPAKLKMAFVDGKRREERATRMGRQVLQYLSLKTLMSLATGASIGIWLAILGLDFVVLWAFLAFALNFIPNIGSVIAAVPAVLLAVVQLGLGKALMVAIGYVVVNMVIGNFIEPAVMGHQLGLSPLVVFLSLIVWGWIWGPVGMLLSVPLTMIVKISMEYNENLKPIAILLGPAPEAAAPVKEPPSED